MKKKGLLTIFSISMFGLLISTNLMNKEANYNSLSIKDKQYIIIFNSKTDKAKFDESTKELKEYIDIKEDYSGLFDGYLIKTSSLLEDYFYNLSFIESFSENHTIKIEKDTVYDSSTIFTKAITNNSKKDMNVPSDSNAGAGTLVAVLDDSFSLSHEAFKDLGSDIKKKLTKSDVDTIVNSDGFLAKNLNGKYYYNDKIPYYHDYGGVYNNGSVVEDNNVESKYDDHGMHVASIATANGEVYEGIAKNAQLAFMKVTSEYTSEGSTSEAFVESSAYINALNDAYLLGADIINMSFGASLSEKEDEAINIVLNKLSEKYIAVCNSAGNDGKGNWSQSGVYQYDTTDFVNEGTIGSLTNYSKVIGVASSNVSDDSSLNSDIYLNDERLTTTREQVYPSRSSSDTITLPSMKFSTLLKDDELEDEFEYVVVPGTGSSSDYKNINVKGKIALILRGTTTFADKINTAYKNGAIGCIIGNNITTENIGFFAFESSINFLPTLSIENEEYLKLVNASDKKIKVRKIMASSFSSQGTNDKLEIVNEISAVGQNVAGAVNLNSNNKNSYNTYAYMSGTSMASPNFAGALSVILGEQEFNNEEEEVEFKKTLLARTMSTASIIESKDGVPESVRKQGAGVVNVSQAIESDIYLTGNSEEGAKVELKNNDDIKSGNIKFDVTIHNENKKTGTFKAKLSITTNDIETYNSGSNESLKGVTYKKDSSQLLDIYEFDVNLTGEETQAVSVSYSLKDDTKKYLDSTFEVGTFIEGYLELDSSSLPSLSIPYMGYYGDYNKVSVVEPFDFEKEEGKIYESDLLNNLCEVTGLNKPNANFSSLIAATTGGSKIQGISNILSLDSNPRVIYNEVVASKDDEGIYHIYAGKNGIADTLYIQQFINRSVLDNDLYLIDSNGKIVLEDHMFDAIYGEDETDNTHPLYKSVATSTLFSKGYVAHRAYTILPLKEKSNDTYYEDGIYTLEFNYYLADGSKQTLSYKLEISSTSEGIPLITNASLKNKEIILYFDKSIGNASINGVNGVITSNGSGSIVKFDLSSLSYKDGLVINIKDASYNELIGLVAKDGKSILFGDNLKSNYYYELTKANYDGLEEKASLYNITVKNKSNVNQGFKGNFILVLDLGNSYKNSTIKAYNYVSKQLANVEFYKEGSVVILNNVSKSFVIEGNKSASPITFILCGVGALIIIAGCLSAFIIIKIKKSK